MNKILLVGHVGRDAEFRTSTSNPYCILALATNENYQDKFGQWKSETDWHRVKIIGRNAERAAATIKKGDMIMIEGKIESYQHENKTIIEVKAFNFKNFSKASNDN